MREQLSFLSVLLQVRVAFGATSPAGHFTSSEKIKHWITKTHWEDYRSCTATAERVNQPHGVSVVTYRCSPSCSSEACGQADRYTRSSPESWCSQIYNLHDLYYTHQYLWKKTSWNKNVSWISMRIDSHQTSESKQKQPSWEKIRSNIISAKHYGIAFLQ